MGKSGAKGVAKPKNSGKPWSRSDDVALRGLYDNGASVRNTALKLGRTSDAVRSRIRLLVMSSRWRGGW